MPLTGLHDTAIVDLAQRAHGTTASLAEIAGWVEDLGFDEVDECDLEADLDDRGSLNVCRGCGWWCWGRDLDDDDRCEDCR